MVNKHVKNKQKRKMKYTKDARKLNRLKPLDDSDDDQEMMTMTQGNEVYLTINTQNGNKKIFKGKYDQSEGSFCLLFHVNCIFTPLKLHRILPSLVIRNKTDW